MEYSCGYMIKIFKIYNKNEKDNKKNNFKTPYRYFL